MKTLLFTCLLPNLVLNLFLQRMDMTHKKMADLILEHPDYAQRLHARGIDVMAHAQQTWAEFCSDTGVMLSPDKSEQAEQTIHFDFLKTCPTQLLVEYLEFQHQKFIKHLLPYYAQLIQQYMPTQPEEENLAQDFKTTFPIFHSDFIHHIHEEEDQVFLYTRELLKKEKDAAYAVAYKGAGWVAHITHEHTDHDDALCCINRLMKDYPLKENSSFALRILFQELYQFEELIHHHARVENELFFPKLATLYQRVFPA